MTSGYGARLACFLMVLACLSVASVPHASAFGDATEIEIVSVMLGSNDPNANGVTERLAWEVRKRTSVDPKLEPGSSRLEDPALFRSPILYWRGEEEFPPLSDAAVDALRTYVRRGGFIFIDDASAGGDGFDRAVRRTLLRAFPAHPLQQVPEDHTIYRSFYLVERPVGRVRGPDLLEGIAFEDRIAVVYSRHDVGGALERDRLGGWTQAVVPGGQGQRERAIRLAVNLVLYALCTDYKDDQVHAPFIMRRRGSLP